MVNENNSNAFNGEIIKNVANAKGITMYALARGTGISQATLSKIINSKTGKPREKTLLAIADFLDVEPQVLGLKQKGAKPIVERGPFVPVYSPRALACFSLGLENHEALHLVAYPFAETEDVDENLLSDFPTFSESELVCLRVTGSSAEPIYKHGDLIFLKTSDLDVCASCDKDMIAVCILGAKGEEYAAVRKIIIDENGSDHYWAVPINPNYPNQEPANNPEIVGAIIGFLGSPRSF